MSDFWNTGVSITPGVRIPYITLFKCFEFWIDCEYTYFSFDSKAEFPVDYYYQNPVVNFDGNSISTYYIYLRTKISPRNTRSRFALYLNIDQGFYHRSPTVFRADSELFGYSRIEYANTTAYAAEFGLDFKFNERLKIFTEIGFMKAGTNRPDTWLRNWRVGIAVK